jgi:hypothetical protein
MSNVSTNPPQGINTKRGRLARCSILLLGIIACVPTFVCMNSPRFDRWLTEYRYQAQANRFLDTPVERLDLYPASVDDILSELANSYHVPLSLIEGTPPILTSNIHVHKGTVRDVLGQMAASNRSYHWRNVMGRLVLLPKQPMYYGTDRWVGVAHMPRFEALNYFYGDHIKYVRGFPRVSVLSIPMQTTLHLMKDPVTVSSDGTLIEHLVELLGLDTSITFRISRANFAIQQVELPPNPSSRLTQWWQGLISRH